MGIYSSDQALLLGFFFFFQKGLRYLSFAIGTALLAKLPLFFQIFDSGFRLDILRGAILWHGGEREGWKLTVEEGVVKIIFRGTFFKTIISPTPHSWSNHIKRMKRVKASELLCGGEMWAMWGRGINFRPHFGTSAQTTGPVCCWRSIRSGKAQGCQPAGKPLCELYS